MQVVYRQAQNGSKQHYAGKPPYCVLVDHGRSLQRDLAQNELEYTDKVKSFMKSSKKNTFRYFCGQINTDLYLKPAHLSVFIYWIKPSKNCARLIQQLRVFKSIAVDFPEAAIFIGIRDDLENVTLYDSISTHQMRFFAKI